MNEMEGKVIAKAFRDGSTFYIITEDGTEYKFEDFVIKNGKDIID